MLTILVSSLSDTSLRAPFEYLTPGGGGYGDQNKGGLLLEEDLHHIGEGNHITPRTIYGSLQTNLISTIIKASIYYTTSLNLLPPGHYPVAPECKGFTGKNHRCSRY